MKTFGAISGIGSKKNAKSITFIDKTHRVSDFIENRYKTNGK